MMVHQYLKLSPIAWAIAAATLCLNVLSTYSTTNAVSTITQLKTD